MAIQDRNSAATRSPSPLERLGHDSENMAIHGYPKLECYRVSQPFSLIFPIKLKIVADASIQDLIIFLPNLIVPKLIKLNLKFLLNFCIIGRLFFNKHRLQKTECSCTRPAVAFGCNFFQHLSSVPKSRVFLLQHFLKDSQIPNFDSSFFSFGLLQGKEDPLVRCKALWAGVFVEGVEDDEKTPISEKNTDVPSEASSIP